MSLVLSLPIQNVAKIPLDNHGFVIVISGGMMKVYKHK